MPVLGHAFVGLGIARYAKPVRPSAGAAAMWAPVLVGLAYLPDILTQLGDLAGLRFARPAAHSVLLTVPVAAVLAFTLAKMAGGAWGRSFLIATVCILSHIGLDLLQATDRTPWWPVKTQPVGVGLQLLQMGLVHELALFGGAYLLLVVSGSAFRRGRDRPAPPAIGGRRWLGYAWTGAVLTAATATHYVRDMREKDFERAGNLMSERRYEQALARLDAARRWPNTARPGRVEYLKAECYLGLGDRAAAEPYYLAAFAADPYDFWITADLAMFYAAGDGPLEERRRRAAPYIERLAQQFAGHEKLPAVLRKLEQRLAPAATTRAGTTAATSVAGPPPARPRSAAERRQGAFQ